LKQKLVFLHSFLLTNYNLIIPFCFLRFPLLVDVLRAISSWIVALSLRNKAREAFDVGDKMSACGTFSPNWSHANVNATESFRLNIRSAPNISALNCSTSTLRRRNLAIQLHKKRGSGLHSSGRGARTGRPMILFKRDEYLWSPNIGQRFFKQYNKMPSPMSIVLIW